MIFYMAKDPVYTAVHICANSVTKVNISSVCQWRFLQLRLLFRTSPEENDLWDEKSLIKSHCVRKQEEEQNQDFHVQFCQI